MDTLSVNFLRVVRLFRLGRILRAFRMIKFMRNFRSMMIAISGSILHLLSALLVMCLFIFVIALVIMQCVASDIYEVAAIGVEEIDTFYGGIATTMMTLFLTVSGGLEWQIAKEPVAKMGAYYDVIWTGYIAFMVFGLLNVLTGIFVDTAMSAMNNDRDNMIQSQLEERKALISTICRVFQNADTNDSGLLSENEIEVLLQDQELIAYLNAIGIDSTEAKGLFQLLDDDQSGSVSIDEFVTGFLRLKGGAKVLDAVTLLHENRKISRKLTKIFLETKALQETLSLQHHGPAETIVGPTKNTGKGKVWM